MEKGSGICRTSLAGFRGPDLYERKGSGRKEEGRPSYTGGRTSETGDPETSGNLPGSGKRRSGPGRRKRRNLPRGKRSFSDAGRREGRTGEGYRRKTPEYL